mmetsp:Transcript_19459/g.41924  ORF Transcript_19459/g.41924 Transcript_19459/m.41924 type:complete len:328 (+) Transcript_19459:350-1333(+)|eukprot:CAMPEP_0168722628 /NCGR_PEP_ID=MMETSP0724-20121128/2696_1 /TAXON_ID=265536 /ORGANISM="Amphiprora sp., Strain CCMP467" /LENGTH=327 /DNA_ID=CAMNT_0008769307 /DNA_START=277 /DNA_END=1260 /DNA_ORIENTATION=+
MSIQFPTTCPTVVKQSAVYLPDKKKVVVIGGADENVSTLGSSWILDLVTGQWSKGPLLSTPRWDLAVIYCQSQGKIYAIGGTDGKSRLNSMEVLDVSNNNIEGGTWTTLPAQYTLKRSARVAVLVVDRFLVVVGGYPTTDTVEIFDLNPPKGSTTTTVQHSGPSMNRQRAYFGAATVQGNTIVVGGGAQVQGRDELEFIEFNTSATTVQELFPEGAQWKIHPTLKISETLSTQLCSLDPKADSLLVIGSQVVELVDLENTKVLPIPQCSFSEDREDCAAVLLPACQQSHPAGVLAIGGLDNPTSMEWVPLPDDDSSVLHLLESLHLS